mgnify:CR=1 FL=1
MSTNSCDYVPPHQIREIRPTRRSVSGQFAFRGRVMVPFESTLERDFLLRAEFFENVTEVIAQPVEVSFTNPDARSYTYTPDYLVYRRDACPELVEVKPAAQWRQHARAWFPKWKAARRHAKARGWTFRLHDESRIRDRALENIRFLQRYGRIHFPEDAALARLVAAVASVGVRRLDDVLAAETDADERRRTTARLWHLVAVRRLDCDVTGVLGGATELRVTDDG